jgi:hypothetical protein
MGAWAQNNLADTTAAEVKLWRPMTSDERIDWYLKRTTGTKAMIRGLAFAGFATLRDCPPEWSRDADGFGRRLAHRQARLTIDNTVQLGVGFLLKDDPRYYRAPEKGFGGRLKNAFVSTFTVRDSSGDLAPAYGRFAGVAISNMAAKAWLPPSRNSWGDVGARSGAQMGFQVGCNLLREFWPDIKKKFRK